MIVIDRADQRQQRLRIAGLQRRHATRFQRRLGGKAHNELRLRDGGLIGDRLPARGRGLLFQMGAHVISENEITPTLSSLSEKWIKPSERRLIAAAHTTIASCASPIKSPCSTTPGVASRSAASA